MSVSAAQVTDIINKAFWAPSPDNCQPWHFEWDGTWLSIFHNSERSSHPLNPRNLASLIMLGCLIEAIAIAASEHGLKTNFEIAPLSDDNHACWAKSRLAPSDQSRDPLANSLTSRTTDRRLFNGGADVLAKFAESRNANTESHVLVKIPANLEAYIIESEQFLVDHPRVLPAIMHWVRFTLKGARETGDGISWRNMLAKFWEVPTMILVRDFPGTTGIFRPAVRRSHRTRTEAQLRSSAGVVMVSVKLTNGRAEKTDLIHAGRLMLRTWLQLSTMGFGVQPLSLSTLPVVYRNFDVMDEFFVSKVELIDKGLSVLRQSFGLADNRLPVWMLRTGKSTPLPEVLRTFRRPTEAVLKIKT